MILVKNNSEPKLILNTKIIPLYEGDIKTHDIHINRNGFVIGGNSYVTQKNLERSEAKKLLQDAYAEKLDLFTGGLKIL